MRTRPDFICLPQALLPYVRTCKVLHAPGQRLQYWGVGKNDHCPLQCVFNYALGYSGSDTHARWDKAALAAGVLCGRRRHAFVTAVERQCQEDSQWSHLAHGPPGPLYDKLAGIVHDTGLQYYARERKHIDAPADTEAAFQRVVQSRQSLARQPQTSVQWNPISGARQLATHANFSRSLLQRWLSAARHQQLLRQHAELSGRDREQHLQQLRDEFKQAANDKDQKQVWGVSRQLSGRSLGPTRRRHKEPASERPLAIEWSAFWAPPDPDGGCEGHPIDWSAYNDQHDHPEPQSNGPHQLLNAFADARSYYYGLLHAIHKLHRRRQPRPDTPLAELWRQLCHPRYYRTRLRTGVGYQQDTQPTAHFLRRVWQLLVAIRLWGQVPFAWQHRGTIPLGSNNGKAQCSALRLINLLDVFGKAYIGQLWKRARKHVLRGYATGYAPNRSRFESIAQHRCLWHRLRHKCWHHITSCYDVANAFL